MAIVTARDRVASAALVIANAGAAMYVLDDPDLFISSTPTFVLGLALILLALPALLAAALGRIGKLADEGIFVNGVLWTLVTALFIQAQATNLARWGIALVFVAATVATFALWVGIHRRGRSA